MLGNERTTTIDEKQLLSLTGRYKSSVEIEQQTDTNSSARRAFSVPKYRLETWICTYPTACLAIGLTLGVVAGWFVKRR